MMIDTTSSSSTALFAHERASTSLEDLAIVRKIVEREGCLEALTQLLTTHARASSTQSSTLASSQLAASATLAAAPMVVTSLLDQLRGVSVDIVEKIDQWKRAHRDHHVFQWRRLNYLAKMLHDTHFLCAHSSTIARVPAFHGLRLERNPLLAPLHLDHAALRDDGSLEMACRLARSVGSVDMKRLFHASRLLLQEEVSLEGSGRTDSAKGETAAMAESTTRLHWSHRPVAMALALSSNSPSLLRTSDPRDTREAMALDVELAKELVFHHEHELGAMREELAVLQRRLQTDLTLQPDMKRKLQSRVASLTHDMKLRTGDLFHRRNELHRKAAVLRMDKRRRRTRTKDYREKRETLPASSGEEESDEQEIADHFTATDTFRLALQADELRRHDLVDAFAAAAKRQAAASATKRKLQSLSPMSANCVASPSSVKGSSSRPWMSSASSPFSRASIETLAPVDVERFIAALPLGDDAPRYGAMLRAKGIDGKLLAQAQNSDLEELGVATRLHRVKILEAIEQVHHANDGATN